jgi:hypothetical protein
VKLRPLSLAIVVCLFGGIAIVTVCGLLYLAGLQIPEQVGQFILGLIATGLVLLCIQARRNYCEGRRRYLESD